MRIAIGGIEHETDTFCALETNLNSFRIGYGLMRSGEAIIQEFKGTRTVPGGFIKIAQEESFDLVPTFFAQAPPGTGIVNAETFRFLEQELIEKISSVNVDGILLYLHGAMVAEGCDEAEADILRRVRETAGEHKPIVVVHDLHANISDQWLDYADAIIGYKTSPHVDEFERGLEAGRVISSIIHGKIKPTMALAKPPILIGGGLMTIVDDPLGMIKPPMHRLVQLAKKMEREDRVVNVTVAGGFGHADVPRAGIGMLVTTNNAPELAKKKVEELSNMAWELRSQFLPSQVLTSLKDSMEQAISATEGPVVLADQGDNAAGGGPADGTFILAALKELDWPDAVLVIKDAIVARQAAQSGIGSEVSVSAGAKTDKLHGEPVEFSGTVSHLSNGIYKGTREHFTVRMGETAVIECGHTAVVFTQSLAMQIDPRLFTSQGIDPRRKRIVVVKSAHTFRHLFGKFASQIIEVDTPGVTSPNLSNFHYRNVRRPIFPLDDL